MNAESLLKDWSFGFWTQQILQKNRIALGNPVAIIHVIQEIFATTESYQHIDALAVALVWCVIGQYRAHHILQERPNCKCVIEIWLENTPTQKWIHALDDCKLYIKSKIQEWTWKSTSFNKDPMSFILATKISNFGFHPIYVTISSSTWTNDVSLLPMCRHKNDCNSKWQSFKRLNEMEKFEAAASRYH